MVCPSASMTPPVSEKPRNKLKAKESCRSDQVIEGSALTLYVIDGVIGHTSEDLVYLERFKQNGRRVLIIWNKIDANVKPWPQELLGFPVSMASATQTTGFNQLLATVGAMIGSGYPRRRRFARLIVNGSFS